MSRLTPYLVPSRLVMALLLSSCTAMSLSACDKKSDISASAVSANPTSAMGVASTHAANKAQTSSASLQHKGSPSSLFLGETDKDYFYSLLPLEKGAIRQGDTIDGVGSKGERASFQVKKVKISTLNPDSGMKRDEDASIINAGQEGSVELTLLNGTAKYGDHFFFVNQGAPYPEGAGATAQAEEQAKQDANGIVNVTNNGKPWAVRIASPGAGYYPKGAPVISPNKPYFIFATIPQTGPDERQVTFTLRDWQPTLGVVDNQHLEVLVSGSPTGDKNHPILLGFMSNKAEYKEARMHLEVTRLEKQGDQAYMMDVHIDGKFTGVLGSKQEPLALKGTIKNMRVGVFVAPPPSISQK